MFDNRIGGDKKVDLEARRVLKLWLLLVVKNKVSKTFGRLSLEKETLLNKMKGR